MSERLIIELEYETDTEEGVEAIREAGRMAAKHWYAAALLCSNKRKPTVVMHSHDFFEGTERIELAEDI